jgi:aminocarboxymuconate-semialdehyde decarboxylase
MTVVDVHAHADVPEIAGLVAGRPGYEAELAAQLATFGPESVRVNVELSRTTYRSPLDDLATRLADMDRGEVDVQVVSVIPNLYHYWADTALADEIVAAANERIAATVAGAPARLVGLGTVALQHPERAAEQLRAAMTRLGLRGVEISTAVAGGELDDRRLDPFWAACEELAAFVFVHPWGCSLGPRLADAYLGNIVGNPSETTVALSRIVFGGVLDRFPGLRICAAHGGGYFPHYLGRADHAYAVRPESRTMARPPSEYLDSLYVDSLVYVPDELRRLAAVMGADRVLLGTDYPFDMGVADPVARVRAAGLGPADSGAVLGATAAKLLNLDL